MCLFACEKYTEFFFNYNDKVGRANAFLIKFIQTMSLQLKKKKTRASYMQIKTLHFYRLN